MSGILRKKIVRKKVHKGRLNYPKRENYHGMACLICKRYRQDCICEIEIEPCNFYGGRRSLFDLIKNSK